MLRPGFENTFNDIVEVLADKQAHYLSSLTIGNFSKFTTQFSAYPVFVVLQTQDNIVSENPDSLSMNHNLDYLLNQWAY